jgi:hypothetical protein
MKTQFISCVLFLLACLACDHPVKIVTPGEIWADDQGVYINAHGGGLLYVNDTYYWYGEHKTEGAGGNTANVGVHCYSSANLYDWVDEGIVLPVMPEGSGSDIEKGCILERPKVIYNERTKKYAMWFHLEPKGAGYTEARSGIAVADRPQGPFTFIKSVRPNAGHWPLNYPDELKTAPVGTGGEPFSGGSLPAHPDSLHIVGRDFEGGQMARDMTLFVDDDGKAYHIYSSEENSTLQIALLADDYLDHSGTYARFFIGRFMEAPAMFKKGGKYYLMMSGCTGWAPNEARSAVASSIWGEWKELGNPCAGEDAGLTFHSQSTYILPVAGKPDTYIYMGDRWTPDNAIDGRYIWLPIQFEGERFIIEWKDSWRV